MTEDNEDQEAFELSLGIGQVCEFEGRPISRVIGKDHYILRAFDGQEHEWDSFTLVSIDEKEGPAEKKPERWWAANLPEIGPHFFRTAKPEEQDHECHNPGISGYVVLSSDGDSTMSGGAKFARGALAIYSKEDGTIYVEEILDGANRLAFIGVPYTP